MPALCLVLIVAILKLAGIAFFVSLPWWLITMPLWFGLALALIVMTVSALAMLSLVVVAVFMDRR